MCHSIVGSEINDSDYKEAREHECAESTRYFPIQSSELTCRFQCIFVASAHPEFKDRIRRFGRYYGIYILYPDFNC
jgi:hypothetical protein